MPNKIEHNIPSILKHIPEKGDIYRSAFDEFDGERYILCQFHLKEILFMLVSLRTGHFWNYPDKDVNNVVKGAIFVGRNMTITLS